MTTGDGTDGGYVHDPAAFDDETGDDERAADTGGNAAAAADGEESAGTGGGDWIDEPAHPATADREFGRRGWALVGAIVFAFVICPVAILLVPPGTDYRFALLILPLAPAALLAVTAVWATTRP